MQVAYTNLDASSSVIAPGPAFASDQISTPLVLPPSLPSSNTFKCNNAAGESDWVEGEADCDDLDAGTAQPVSNIAPGMGLLLKDMVDTVTPYLEVVAIAEPTDIPLPPALGMLSRFNIGEVVDS